MNSYAEVNLEMNLRRRGLPYETEREQQARLYTLFRSPVPEESGIQQIAVRLGDLVAEVRCRLQSRFASETAATGLASETAATAC